jgi:ferredoxin
MTVRLKSLKLVCFSPTGTAKSILVAVARGINHGNTDLIDLTKPGTRKLKLQTSEKNLLVVAVPVYMGRVPALLLEWLNGIVAYGSPAVCIVVYGNRAYDNALIELGDILIKHGCTLIAGAAFIEEHSYSSSVFPIAKGRPDKKDIYYAEYFGQTINEKLSSVSSIDQIQKVFIPGNCPDGDRTKIWSLDFITVNRACTQCGTCSERCPVGAIDAKNSHLIDKEKCITCCACIRYCPQKAKAMKSGPVKDAAMRLGMLYKERKEPVCFI